MKKLFLSIYAAVLLPFFGMYAGDDGDVLTKQDNTKLTKEERKMLRQQKREARKLKREQEKQECSLKKEQKKVKKQKKSKEERELEKQHRKIEKNANREMRRQQAKDDREQRKLDKIHKIEKRKADRIGSENRGKIKREQRRLKRQQCKEAEHMSMLNERKERAEKLAKLNAEKENNLKLVQTWKTVRQDAVESDMKQGKYADLYMLPAWPVSSWFYKEKALINSSVFYYYATQAYDSDGASRDLTALAFGESPIHVKDVILASKLFNEDGTNTINWRSPTWISPINDLVQLLGDQEIELNGRTEKYGLSLDFMHHVLNEDISVGIQVPMMFMKNRLRLHMSIPTEYDFFEDKTTHVNQFELTTHPYHEALKRIFRTKDINEFGGSASGIGDITLFGNINIKTNWVDRMIAGVKVVLPTAKKTTANKLWAPEMGNGGCPEIAAFISFLIKYKQYINPHLFLQAGFSSPVHLDKRVPRWVEYESNSEVPQDLPINLMSLSDRLQGTSFSSWDSTIRGFSDKSVSVKFEKGPEVTARLGNIFDKFLFRRGFMDIFYNLCVKFEDSYRQVCRDKYKIGMLEDNTRQVEHRIGFEYSHQYDSCTRMKAGMAYTFAGVNVPKAFDLGVSFAHSF